MSIHYLTLKSFLCIVCITIFVKAPAQNNIKDSLKDSIKLKSKGISREGFGEFEKKSAANVTDRELDSLQIAAQKDRDTLVDESGEYNEAYVKYQIWNLGHRSRVFEWQLTSSRYIFIVVIAIVAMGLLLSFWQFYLPIHKFNKIVKANSTKTAGQSETVISGNEAEKQDSTTSTLKFGKDGIEITSSVIGLLILLYQLPSSSYT